MEDDKPITSRELIKNCGGDPDAPFEPGPFPQEMREPSLTAEESEWRSMDTAPRDGTIVRVRSAHPMNPVEFAASYMCQRGLSRLMWCPLGGGFPWRDNELNGWRPVEVKISTEAKDPPPIERFAPGADSEATRAQIAAAIVSSDGTPAQREEVRSFLCGTDDLRDQVVAAMGVPADMLGAQDEPKPFPWVRMKAIDSGSPRTDRTLLIDENGQALALVYVSLVEGAPAGTVGAVVRALGHAGDPAKAIHAIDAARHSERAALALAEEDARDAARYRWLRADNAYRPEEMGFDGGPDLDALCDEGIEEAKGEIT